MEVFSGELTATSLLPPEIWNLVLDKVTDPKELRNCSRVCTTWNDVLEERKPLFYFSLVLPDLMPYLKKNDLLKCCKVSKSWNSTLDAHVNHLIEIDNGDITVLRNQGSFLGFDNSLTSKLVINSFLNEICALPPVNLMPYRNINLTYVNPGEQAMDVISPDFLPKVDQYLTKYGPLVRSLRVGCITLVANSAFNDFGEILPRWLLLTPNIKILTIFGSVIGNWAEGEGRLDPSDFLERFPLPDLPHLKTLFICSNAPEVLNLLLIRYGAQLETIAITWMDMVPSVRVFLPDGVRLSRLQKLEVYIDCLELVERWRAFFQSQDLNLKQLKVACPCEVDRGIAEGIVEFVNEYHSGLEEFFVEYEESSHADLESTFGGLQGLKLPNAKLTAFEGVGLSSVEVLANMAPLLEQLQINFTLRSNGEEVIYVDLYEEHGFWEVLPAIKSVKVKLAFSLDESDSQRRAFKRVYSRGMYEHLMTNV